MNLISMKKYLSLLFVITSIIVVGQQKYQSLLWKISHKDLPKDSYLYGTMHVSGKVAFNLDDVFYESLLKVDAVALESDPTTWLEDSFEMLSSGRFGNLNAYVGGYYGQEDFYERLFGMEPVKRQSIRNFIRFDNSIINNFLYRKNRGLDNFEEETYLDMFIFQAGKKKEKSVISLEDFNESMMLTTRASFKPNKDKIDPWLQKRYKKENSFLLLENAYRNRNLDLIDSIGVASNSDFYREHMLFIRNKNMVHVLDSVLQQKTVFAGVGAAHLPGEHGVIELLRKKGYAVTPLTSKKTSYGKLVKKELEAAQLKPVLKKQQTSDDFLTIKSFGKLQELNLLNQKYYIATDMTNGGFLAVTRINTFDYLHAKPKDLLKEINDLLYEDIPGQIIEKEMISSPFPGIKILNKTKKNDYQRYLIYRTPLEIIIVKLGGKGEYALTYGEEILGSLVFKKPEENQTTYTSKYNKYSVIIPAKNISENTNHRGKKLIQAYNNDGFYFLKEAPVFDTDYIEEDIFEAKYIPKAFLKKAELTPINVKNTTAKNYSSYTTKAVVDSVHNKYLVLKSIIKDASYYLLGYAGKDTLKAKPFFNSLTFHDKVNDKKYEIVKDTSLHFSVKTNIKPPMSFITNYQKNNTSKSYEPKTSKAQYVSKANELIDIKREKFHDLKMYENIDSLWKEVDEKYADFKSTLKNSKKYKIIDRKKTNKDGVYSYSFSLADEQSSKRILVKNILKKGTLFELKSLTDTVSGTPYFVATFFNTFTPKDTLLGRSPLTDKVGEFLEAMKNKDSISHNLYNSVVFRKKDVSALVDVIRNVKFSDEDRFRRSFLMRKVIELDGESPRVISFAKSMYEKSYSDPEMQLAILGELLDKNTLKSQELFLELLDIDFPVGSNNNMFFFNRNAPLSVSLETKKRLFPEVLKYSSITEYKKPIYTLLSTLIEKNILKPKIYKKYKDQLFNDARIELKRSFSDNSIYGYSDLTDYTRLLYPFKTEKKIQHWYDKLLESNDADALAMYYGLLNKHKTQVPKKLKDTLFNNLKYFKAMVDEVAKDDLLPKSLNTKEYKIKYAKAALFADAYDFDKLKIEFLKTITEQIDDKKVEVYFFKSKEKNSTRPNEEFSFIAFEQKKGVINIASYYESSNNNISNTSKSDKELIDEALNKVRYKNRQRLSGRNGMDFN